MSKYFNDSPIETADQDQYGLLPFAQPLAKSIRSIRGPIGTTIAITGPWGSGKSSAINLVRRELEDSNEAQLVVSEFKCWWFRGEEALALAFLQNLHALLEDTISEKVKGLVPALGRGLLQAGPVVGAAIAATTGGPFGPLASSALKFSQRFFPKGDTLEKTFRKLSEVLEDENRRYLIIVDDLDRLSPEEAIAVFRIIKSVGRLPNVMYLVAFDRELADKAVNELYPSEGPHFLEKIIQASFDLPMPFQTDLNAAVFSSIEEICGSPGDENARDLLNMYFDVVAPYITTPRHVARFQNTISVTWPAIANEVRLADFIALETLRLYEPTLFRGIRSAKSHLCGTGSGHGRGQDDRDRKFDRFLSEVGESSQETAKLALQRLFPRLESIGYSEDSLSRWDAERRVCVEAHFDTYFRLALSDEVLPIERTGELTERADDDEFIKKTFREAAEITRRSGSSMVPVLLDELNTHALEVTKEKVEPLLRALFEIHDEIDLEIDDDKGMMSHASTSLRYHWLIRRLTRDRFSLGERTSLFLASTENAALGWLVDFVDSARTAYKGKETKREEDCLTDEDSIVELTERALSAIRESAKNDSLLYHRDVMSIIYRWRDFCGDQPDEVRAWTDALLGSDHALIILASRMTGTSWSQGLGMFGLGDRVSTPHVQVQLDETTDIIDVPRFMKNLEELQRSGRLDDESQSIVDIFLDARVKKRRGDDD